MPSLPSSPVSSQFGCLDRVSGPGWLRFLSPRIGRSAVRFPLRPFRFLVVFFFTSGILFMNLLNGVDLFEWVIVSLVKVWVFLFLSADWRSNSLLKVQGYLDLALSVLDG